MVFLLILSHPVRAALTLPSLFSDHMVFQRQMKAPVWGTADAGAKITVQFAGQSVTAVADKDGKWRADLEPMEASDQGRDLTVSSSAGDTMKFTDVLVGEVWLGSGQSNMDMALYEFAPMLPAAAPLMDNRLLRFHGWRQRRDDTTKPPVGWVVSTAKSAPHCSCLLLFFGAAMQKELGVPVGLLPRARGGSASGSWCPKAAFEADATLSKAAMNQKHRAIGRLFEVSIRPAIPFAIRGVVWDQGESGTRVRGVGQAQLMPVLIDSWRRDWGRSAKDMFFILTQKPGGGGPRWTPKSKDGKPSSKPAPQPKLPDAPDASGWVREDYQTLVDVPGVVVANSYDLGGGAHPGDKHDYGRRLADAALGAVYGREGAAWRTPRFSKMEIVGGKVLITFKDCSKGLTLRPTATALNGFTIAGADRKFVWAQARITAADTVEVWSDQVAAPVAVRYNWTGGRWANLFSKDGLPVWSFRTDDWPRPLPDTRPRRP